MINPCCCPWNFFFCRTNWPKLRLWKMIRWDLAQQAALTIFKWLIAGWRTARFLAEDHLDMLLGVLLHFLLIIQTLVCFSSLITHPLKTPKVFFLLLLCKWRPCPLRPRAVCPAMSSAFTCRSPQTTWSSTTRTATQVVTSAYILSQTTETRTETEMGSIRNPALCWGHEITETAQVSPPLSFIYSLL